MKNSVKLIFASALLITAVSCTQVVDLQTKGESPVRFDVGVDGTKAALVNSETDNTFKTSGFYVIAYEGTTKKMDKVVVTYSGSAWTYTGDYLWKKNTTMRFFAYYPQALATTLDGKTTNSGIAPFTYSPLASGVTADVMDQTDYMLATYNGQGNNEGKASLSFSHPLASIKFVVGDFDSSVTAIKSIEIGGFYKTATCTPTAGDAGFTYAWSNQSDTADDGALSQTGLNLTPDTNTVIGTPFLLIPGQDFSSKNLSVLLTVTIGGADKTLLATINSGTLEQGITTKFTINYDLSKELTCTLAEYTANNDDDIFDTKQPIDEIWYTTSDGQPITIYTGNGKQAIDYFGVNLLSNTYAGGKGILKFDGDIQKIDSYKHHSPFFDNANLTSISLPPSSIPLKDECFAMNYGCTIYFPDTYTNSNVSGSILWRAAEYGSNHIFYLVTSKGTIEFNTSGGYIYIEFADGSRLELYNGYCFAKGTLVTLADGSRKPVEELKFDDKLKVWNFDEGHEDVADILN